MGHVNLDELLSPVSEEATCGPDLSYDDRFFAVENASKGKPPTFLGEQEIPGEPPDWREVRNGAADLLKESRDLRLAVLLAKAHLAMDGFEAFEESLRLIAGLMEEFWEKVHPELDEDDPDPIERTNALADLASRESGGGLNIVFDAPLTGQTNFGQFSLRDYEIITGAREPGPVEDEDELPTLSAFNAAMEATSVDELKSARDAVDSAIEATTKIESVVREKSEGLVQLEPLRQALQSARSVLEENLQARGEGDGAEGGGGETVGAAGGGGVAQAATLPASVSSREQAVKAIDLAIGFFERNEPSHPAPLILHRAKVLINKPFLDVIDELFKLSDDVREQVRRELGIPPEHEYDED